VSDGEGAQPKVEQRPTTAQAFLEYVANRMVCFGGVDNSPCRLNQSSDPEEFCLYHMAHDILALRSGDSR
jgi:hypothetical protein